ncbi:MAG: hypothetical protein IT379_15000 [Deltaproteobacteria bacterium]|nr:hypothetical protein [Deltaproteobacteria bacterium]
MDLQPVPPAPPPSRIRGLTFDEVRAGVAGRAEMHLPDVVVPLAELAMTPDGNLALPDKRSASLTPWSRSQLATLLGVRWDKWFAQTNGSERADEVNRRLARIGGERKLRLAKPERDGAQADAVLRAFLAPAFTAIDDHKVFSCLASSVRLDELRFVRVEVTDRASYYAAVSAEVCELGTNGTPDRVYPGFLLRNSEVGYAALSLDDLFFRQICSNGLLMPIGGKRLLRRTHRAIDDDKLTASLVLALAKLPARWHAGETVLRLARGAVVDDVVATVEAILDDPTVPRSVVKVAVEVARGAEDRTRFGVVQAITSVAHVQNRDPEVRFAMERLAGAWLAAA